MKHRILFPVAIFSLFSLGAVGCSADSADDELFPEDRCNEEGVTCQAYGRQNHQNKPPAYELGDGVRTPTLKLIHQGYPGSQPVDLEFNPRSPRELWIVSYATHHLTIIKNAGTTRQASVPIERRDPAYSHYMYMPSALAMGGPLPPYGQTWAACGDNDSGGRDHMGPTLFTADLSIFATQNPYTGLGSHLDMLHSTSYCRGLSWAGQGNQYWAFNADKHAIDFYDFKSPHEPGGTDHSDGVVRRYWNNQVKGVDGVMSHIGYNPDDKKVYIADTGNKRILALDPSQGVAVAPFPGTENIAERQYYEAPIKVVVPPGNVLQAPSGIEASGGLAFVTDAATSKIHAFKLSDGSLVRTFDTGLAPWSLAGLNFGPEGKIYFVDRREARVYRIDP